MAIRYVSNGFQLGDDGWTGENPINVPPGTGPYKTIQHGVDELAKLSDPVKILNLYTYEYRENVRMHGPSYSGINVVGFRLGSYNPAILVQFCEARPLINGQNSDRVFDIADATGIVLKNLNIANGKTPNSGAGVAAQRSHVDLIGCCIHDNNADENGGGFWFSKCKVSGKVCHVEDCYVWQNSAGKNGGGGDVNDSRWVEVSRTLFHENKAVSQGGGGLCVYDSSHVTVHDKCIFDHNHAPTIGGTYYGGGSDGLGGGVLVDRCDKASATISVSGNCRFEHNDAGRFGGGLCAAHRSYVDIEDAAFLENSASSGGGLAVAQAITAYGGLTLTLPSALRSGSRIVTVKHCTFVSNQAVNNGAGVYATTEAYVVFEQSLFDKNNAGFDGGGISASYDSQIDLIRDNTFSNNVATAGNGGAIRVRNANLVVTASNRFVQNQAPAGQGGAIFFSGEHETTPSIVDYDKLLYNAGFREADLYILDRNQFTGNQAKDGGAISVRWRKLALSHVPQVKLTVAHENQFDSNMAVTGEGGAILASELHRPSIADKNRFDNNRSATGGAIRFFGCGKVKVVNNAYTNNGAGLEGGAIGYKDCEKITLTGNSFAGNTAPTGTDLRFVDCSMSGQTANAISAANGGNVGVSITP